MEQDIIIRRLYDLAKKAYNSSCFTFSDFLSASQLSDFYGIENDNIFKGYKIFGGYDNAERVMIRFGNEEELGYSVEFPIDVIRVEPLLKKFSDEFSHRDYLGALMNLGITRETLGDIILNDKTAYVIVNSKMSDFILDNLNKVKHTSVKAIISRESDINNTISFEEKNIIASSCRIDGVMSKVLNISRETSLNLFRNKKVFLNGRLYENNSYQLKAGDIISVRGYGKFIFECINKITKSGKFNIKINIYS